MCIKTYYTLPKSNPVLHFYWVVVTYQLKNNENFSNISISLLKLIKKEHLLDEIDYLFMFMKPMDIKPLNIESRDLARKIAFRSILFLSHHEFIARI